MSRQTKPQKAKLFLSIIYKDEENLKKSLPLLEKSFGVIDFLSESIPFDQTTYYNKEMGEGLVRRFVTFKNLIERDEIKAIKHKAYKIENEFKMDKSRTVNLDPGIVTLENVCLSTFKNYGHRIYLGEGVYIEVTLIYKKTGYRSLDWTYPDYKSEKIIDIFNEIRNKYKKEMGSDPKGA